MARATTILFLTLLIFNSAITITTAQPEISNLEHFGIEEGISQSIITDIYIDSFGFIWLGTQDGVNKYDGYDFVNYRHEPIDKESLSSNYVRMIMEDSDSNIWMATQYGISVYSHNTNKFSRILHQPDNKNSLSSNDVYYIFEDSEQNIWIKTYSTIDKYNKKTKTFTSYPHYHDLFSYIVDYNRFDIAQGHQDDLWIATKDGLLQFDKKLEQFKRFSYIPNNAVSISNNQVRSIFVDKNHTVWVGTQQGLNQINTKNLKFRRFFNKPNNSLVINDISEYSDTVLLLATKEGMYFFHKKSKKLKPYTFEDTKFGKINRIRRDKSNILWIATDNGLFKADQKPKKFNIIRSNENGFPKFTDDHIMSLLIDKQKNLWLGTRYNGINRYNLITKKLEIYTTSNKKIPNDEISVLYLAPDSTLWAGTSNGLVFFDPTSNSFNDFQKRYNIQDSNNYFQFNRIYDIKLDSHGKLWVATQNGLRTISKQDGVKSYFFDPYNKRSLSSNEVFCLLEKKDQSLWIGTLNGLNRYNPKTDDFDVFQKNESLQNGLSNNSVLSLLESDSGELWVGTESGLNKYNPKKQNFTFYTQRDGFINDYIYSILEDENNNLWVSTNRGLAAFSPHSRSVNNFDLDDGLQHYEFNIGAAFEDEESGLLYFGGLKGVNFFNPQNIKKNGIVPPVTITKIEKQGSNGKETLRYKEGSIIKIFPSDINLTIQFATLEYTNPEKNQYVYKLEGLDNEWVETEGAKHSATYSKLPAGNYTFTVIGSNSDSAWSPVPTHVKIKVYPPLWKTTTAYIIYFLTSVSLLITLIMLITRNLRKSNMELLEKNKMSFEVERQKEELTLKNKNITDSLNYAKRIIDALMPSQQYFKSLLPNSFILYKPKDIVSGDFYWITQKNNKVFFTAADCTGHGVPGAFMSIIGIDILRKIIINSNIEAPNEILNRLNEEIENTFDKKESDHVLKDGMDLAFCVLDVKTKKIDYAGAFNPLYILRNNNIIEIEPDRFSVGVGDANETKIFTKKSVQLEKNDMIYIFSDGYTDQFGGPKGKKFKHRRFRHLLLTIHQLDVEKQKTILEKSLQNWQGTEEQVDDILIVGIKIQ